MGRAQAGNSRGAAGVRLRPHLRSAISPDLLKDFASTSLGAQRCSAKYLDALRTVLGNQSDAEQHGYLLELNVRTEFATPRTMRTILDQMHAAGLTFSKYVKCGDARSQVVQCFGKARRRCTERDAFEELERIYRAYEGVLVDSEPMPVLESEVCF